MQHIGVYFFWFECICCKLHSIVYANCRQVILISEETKEENDQQQHRQKKKKQHKLISIIPCWIEEKKRLGRSKASGVSL